MISRPLILMSDVFSDCVDIDSGHNKTGNRLNWQLPGMYIQIKTNWDLSIQIKLLEYSLM